MTMNMKWMAGACLIAAVVVAGCEGNNGANEVTDNIEESLNQANLDDVSVDQDADKGVVTLTGAVRTEADKERAEAIAKAAAPRDVIANEIRVEPAGMEGKADDIADDLDAGIERNLEAEFTKANIDGVTHDVNTQVVTLTGEVDSAAERTRAEKLAAGVPNVKQVVNKLEIGDANTADRPSAATPRRPAAEDAPAERAPAPAR
jgi:osmotically-inducible protein OsmY